MPQMTARTETDPVSRAIAQSHLMVDRRPVPLVSTSYRIAIRGGLADVVTKRTFRNVEAGSIEATLTFPLPVHGVLYSLQARIGDRRLDAKARAKDDARADYEGAIDRGKTAVLHEELIKGVHLISVGHIAPNSDIEITARFAIALSDVAGRILLRIPTTVGQIYGSSGLQDCDDLLTGGHLQTADLIIECDSGDAKLLGGSLVSGRGSIALDRPIEIEVRGWSTREVAFRTAAGACKTLRVRVADAGERAIDTAILVDRSGSMNGQCAFGHSATKHEVAVSALVKAARDLRPSDTLHLFQFDDSADEIGAASGAACAGLMRQLSGPNGGTEIGNAIEFACAESAARDILLITDGKSHRLDVQKLARLERRFTLVLIGEDSLDANVGHLAALTGGDIFVPVASEVSGGVEAALRSLRSHRPSAPGQWIRGGMSIEISEADAAETAFDDGWTRAASAFAASLQIASLDKAAAMALAETEGLVTHLTSLVLIDEEGAIQQGLPATRKVPLPAPRCAAAVGVQFAQTAQLNDCVTDAYDPAPMPGSPAGMQPARQGNTQNDKLRRRPTVGATSGRFSAIEGFLEKLTPRQLDLSGVPGAIDWALDGALLSTGDVSCLDSRVGSLILKASEAAEVRKVAKSAKLMQLQVVIGVLAWAVRNDDRHAERVARALLSGLSDRTITSIARSFNLDNDRRAA